MLLLLSTPLLQAIYVQCLTTLTATRLLPLAVNMNWPIDLIIRVS